jgi:hypothetical protein
MLFTGAASICPVTLFLLKPSAQFYVYIRYLNSLLTVSLTLHIQHRPAAAWPVAMKLRIVLRCVSNYSNAETRGPRKAMSMIHTAK